MRLNNKKQRGAQIVIVETPEGKLQVVNWHLGLAEKERHWQANKLLNHRLLASAPDLPTVLAGDANDWRNTLGSGPFAEHGFRQVTTPISRYRTFPAYLPAGSLDKVFMRGNFKVRRVRVVRSKLAKRASDHLPVVVDFHLGK